MVSGGLYPNFYQMVPTWYSTCPHVCSSFNPSGQRKMFSTLMARKSSFAMDAAYCEVAFCQHDSPTINDNPDWEIDDKPLNLGVTRFSDTPWYNAQRGHAVPLGQISGMVIIYYIRGKHEKTIGCLSNWWISHQWCVPTKKSCHFGTSSSRTRGWEKPRFSPFQDGKSCSKPGDEWGDIQWIQSPNFQLLNSPAVESKNIPRIPNTLSS